MCSGGFSGGQECVGDAVSAGVFCLVHELVGSGHEFIEGGSGGPGREREESCRDGEGGFQFGGSGNSGLGDGGDDVLEEALGFVLRAFGHEDGELIAAEASDAGIGSEDFFGGGDEVFECGIAGGVSVGIVECFEAIDVEEGEGEAGAIACGGGEDVCGGACEAVAIEGGGEGIVEGGLFEAILVGEDLVDLFTGVGGFLEECLDGSDEACGAVGGFAGGDFEEFGEFDFGGLFGFEVGVELVVFFLDACEVGGAVERLLGGFGGDEALELVDVVGIPSDEEVREERSGVDGVGEDGISDELLEVFEIVVEGDGVDEDFGEFEFLGDDAADFGVVEVEQVALTFEVGFEVSGGILEGVEEVLFGDGEHDGHGEILEEGGGEGFVGALGFEVGGVLFSGDGFAERGGPEHAGFFGGEAEFAVEACETEADGKGADGAESEEVDSHLGFGDFISDAEP